MIRRTAIVLGLAFLVTFAGFAQPADSPRAGRMKADLKLTQEQQTKLHAMRTEFQKSRIESQAKIRIARIDLATLVAADKPDRKAIEAQVKSMSKLQEQAHLDRIDHMLAMKSILTPEQLALWKEHRMDRGRGMMMHQEMRQNMRRGFRGHGLMGENLMGEEEMNGNEPPPGMNEDEE